MYKKISKKPLNVFTLLTIIILLSISQISAAGEESDPLENINRPIFNFNEGLDKHIMQPIANGYVAITPKLIRTGVTNFFDNLTYLNVIFNDLLQGKFRQSINDSARFLVNSTVGIGGIFDPAGHALPEHNEDLGQTFGTWGAGEGTYLNIPLMGPSSTRDAPDLVTSTLLNPLTYFAFAITAPVSAVNLVNKRANLLDATKFRDEAALDSYAFTREAYRQHRTSLIYDGDPPVEDLEDFFDEEDESEFESQSEKSSDRLIIE